MGLKFVVARRMIDCEDKAVDGGRCVLGVSGGTVLCSSTGTWSKRLSGVNTVVVYRPSAMYVIRLQVPSHASNIVCKSWGESGHTFAMYSIRSFTDFFSKLCSR